MVINRLGVLRVEARREHAFGKRHAGGVAAALSLPLALAMTAPASASTATAASTVSSFDMLARGDTGDRVRRVQKCLEIDRTAFYGDPTVRHVRHFQDQRGIAVTGEKRIKALPDLPAIAETVPGYEVSAWFGLFGPARLPAPILEALYKEAAKAVNEPQLAAPLEAGGTETVGNPPREFTQQAKNEYDKWRNLVKKTGLKLQ